jgi:predicted DNA-binding protein with PD1-like motif
MKYQTGRAGKIIVARFEDGEDVLANITAIARDESLRAAVLYLVGGMKGGRFVVGPEKEEMPPRPVWRELEESHEVIGIGTIFWEGDTPKVHLHGAYGKRDQVRMGCMREDTSTFLVLEAVIMEIQGIEAERALDPVSGMALLKL